MPGHSGIGIPWYFDSLSQFVFPDRSGCVGSHFTEASPQTNVSCSKSMKEYFWRRQRSFKRITNLSISQVVEKSETSSVDRPTRAIKTDHNEFIFTSVKDTRRHTGLLGLESSPRDNIIFANINFGCFLARVIRKKVQKRFSEGVINAWSWCNWRNLQKRRYWGCSRQCSSRS